MATVAEDGTFTLAYTNGQHRKRRGYGTAPR